jgi:serine/threonine protein kinase
VAPELIDGNYDEKCDMWSLGVMLFNCITGVFVNFIIHFIILAI